MMTILRLSEVVDIFCLAELLTFVSWDETVLLLYFGIAQENDFKS